MKLGSRLNNAVLNLRNALSFYDERPLIEPVDFVPLVRDWFQQFVLPLYPDAPDRFLAIQFLFETPEYEIPVTKSSCLRFIDLIKQFSYSDQNDFIRAIAELINNLVIHRHPEWLDLAQGDYEYYYCVETDEVVLSGKILGLLTLSGENWGGEANLVPATRSILKKAGVQL
jgi:hypothetical protein